MKEQREVTWTDHRGRGNLFASKPAGRNQKNYRRLMALFVLPLAFAQAASADSWLSVGEATAGRITSVSSIVGRVDLFVRGTNNVIYHKYKTLDEQWHPSMMEWESLGGATFGDVTAMSSDLMRLDVFVRGTDNVVYYKYFDGAQWYPSMTGWFSLGGMAIGNIAAFSLTSGLIDLFMRDAYGLIRHKQYRPYTSADGRSPGWYPSMTEWDPGDFTGGGPGGSYGTTQGDFTLVNCGGNCWHVFVRDSDNVVQHRYFADGYFRPWESLGVTTPSNISAVSRSFGLVDVFVHETHNRIYHAYNMFGVWGISDLNPSSFPGSPVGWDMLDGLTLDEITAIPLGTDRVDLFVRGTDNVVYHKIAIGASAGPWKPLGETTPGVVGAISVLAGYLDVFARDTSNVIRNSYFDGVNWHP